MEEKVKLLSEPLARRVASSLYIGRPYVHIHHPGMDAFRLFQDHRLHLEVVHSVLQMVTSRGETYSVVTALSSWGYMFALALAEEFERAFSRPCNALCLGEELFPEPLCVDMFQDQRMTLLVDDIIHTGGTIKDVALGGQVLSKYKLSSRLCVVIIDYDVLEPEFRKPLQDVLNSDHCDVFAVTKASYVRESSKPLARTLSSLGRCTRIQSAYFRARGLM